MGASSHNYTKDQNSPSCIVNILDQLETNFGTGVISTNQVSQWNIGANFHTMDSYFNISLDPNTVGVAGTLINPAEGQLIDVYLMGFAQSATTGNPNANSQMNGQHFQVGRTNGQLTMTFVERRIEAGFTPADALTSSFNDLTNSPGGDGGIDPDQFLNGAGFNVLPVSGERYEQQLDGTYSNGTDTLTLEQAIAQGYTACPDNDTFGQLVQSNVAFTTTDGIALEIGDWFLELPNGDTAAFTGASGADPASTEIGNLRIPGDDGEDYSLPLKDETCYDIGGGAQTINGQGAGARGATQVSNLGAAPHQVFTATEDMILTQFSGTLFSSGNITVDWSTPRASGSETFASVNQGGLIIPFGATLLKAGEQLEITFTAANGGPYWNINSTLFDDPLQGQSGGWEGVFSFVSINKITVRTYSDGETEKSIYFDDNGEPVETAIDPTWTEVPCIDEKQLVVTKQPVYEYRDIWAEEGGALNNNSAQWSFGNGATGNIGLPIDAGWEVIGMYLHVDNNAAGTNVTVDLVDFSDPVNAPTIAQVIMINSGDGEANNGYIYRDYLGGANVPAPVPAGAVLGFITATDNGASDGRVGVRLRRQVGEFVSDVSFV